MYIVVAGGPELERTVLKYVAVEPDAADSFPRPILASARHLPFIPHELHLPPRVLDGHRLAVP